MLIYIVANCAPGILAVTRGLKSARRILVLNAAVPLALLALSTVFLHAPIGETLEEAILLAAAAAGLALWMSTLMDALFDPTAGASASEETDAAP